MIAKGSFEVTLSSEPPFDSSEGIAFSRMTVDKRFSGPLDAIAKVYMMAAGTPVKGSGAYVAIERITGTLDGKRGSFSVVHAAFMNRGSPSLEITIIPDSGTGELTGIAGKIAIEITGGRHFYSLEYTLPE